MNPKQYLEYQKYLIPNTILGMITWMSLSTFMLVAKNAIGTNNIPIFETIIFISALIGSSIAAKRYMSYKISILSNILVEMIFLASLYYVLIYYNNLAIAGVVVYCVIIVNGILDTIVHEEARNIEDEFLKHSLYKKVLRKYRKYYRDVRLYGGVIGTSISLIALTYYQVDLLTFTKVMLILNVIETLYSFYLWNKYLR